MLSAYYRRLEEIYRIRRKRVKEADKNNFIPGTSIRKTTIVDGEPCYCFTFRVAAPDLDEEENRLKELIDGEFASRGT